MDFTLRLFKDAMKQIQCSGLYSIFLNEWMQFALNTT